MTKESIPTNANDLRRNLLATCAAVSVVAVSATVTPEQAHAAGFALKEQSATAQGNAFAGATAGAEDVSYMFFNPAGLTRQKESQAAVVLSYIAPQNETKDATTSPFVGGESSTGDVGEDALVPAAYLMWSASPDLKFGLGVNVPFGLSTKYSQTWAGRFDAVESKLKTVNVNPTVAYKVNESLSIGAGIQVQYIDATLSNMSGGGLAEVTGDDWGYGATLGALYEASDTTRIGIGYRSRISHTLDGDLTVGGSPVTGIEADLVTPDMITAGVYHDINDRFALMGEVQWTRWSTFDELRIVSDGGATVALTPENWDNSWFLALGGSWKANDQWTVRGGVAYDQSPIPDATRTPRLPGEDRTWVSLGAQYQTSSNFSFSAGYTHIFIKDSTLNLPDRTGVGGPPSLTATYSNSVDLVTVQATVHF